MDVKSKVGIRIKELRESKQISQKDLAYTADIDRSYIASVESGQRNISIVNIERIASAFNTLVSKNFSIMTGLITIQQAVDNFKKLIEGSIIKGWAGSKRICFPEVS